MVNRYLLFVLLSVLSFSWAKAQIVLTNASFPEAGDSLKIATDFNPDSIVIDPPGGPYAWDYTSLNAEARQVTVFQPAANGSAFANFPTADLFTLDSTGAETYYDVTASAFNNLGFSGGDAVSGFPFVTHVDFTPPLTERYAPTTFFDIRQYQSSFNLAVSLDALPSGILDSLGIPSGLFDSVRIRVNIEQLRVVDAFGTLAIPGGTYDVLRIHDTNYNSIGIDVHTFLGWVDVGSLGFPLDGIGTDTTTTYSYYSNTEKEPIAIVTTTEPNGLLAAQVEYKDNGIPNSTSNPSIPLFIAGVSPNPATDFVSIDLKSLDPDTYTITIFDMHGRQMMVRKTNSLSESLSVGDWSAGLYLFQIASHTNKVLAAGSFVKSSN